MSSGLLLNLMTSSRSTQARSKSITSTLSNTYGTNKSLTHEASRVALVSAHLAVDGDEALHDDGHHFTVGQGVLEPVPQHHHQGQALPLLVGSGGGLGGLNTAINNTFFLLEMHLT